MAKKGKGFKENQLFNLLAYVVGCVVMRSWPTLIKL